VCHWFYTYRIHCAAAADAYTVALKMAESNEFPNRGRGRGYALNKWLEENPIRRRTVGGEGISAPVLAIYGL